MVKDLQVLGRKAIMREEKPLSLRSMLSTAAMLRFEKEQFKNTTWELLTEVPLTVPGGCAGTLPGIKQWQTPVPVPVAHKAAAQHRYKASMHFNCSLGQQCVLLKGRYCGEENQTNQTGCLY